jgi:HD superfamily phosphohydrolase
MYHVQLMIRIFILLCNFQKNLFSGIQRFLKMKMKIFKDPIHGRIIIPDYCVKIIDTIEFQRLRNLKQLGLTYFVFHGATHTRFEHSLGVSHLCGCWIKHLKKTQPELEITDKEIKLVQIAGLLHDIGHGFYSHTFEKFMKLSSSSPNYNHEDMSIKIIRNMKLDLEPEEIDYVCAIILGKSLIFGNGISGKINSRRFVGDIVHNTKNGIDADKLDYFKRDSRCTSFNIGCDIHRIIYESRVYDDEIIFPKKLMGDIWSVYETRFRLFRDVYYHKTVVMIENMFLQALLIADTTFKFSSFQDHKQVEKQIEKFLLMTDDIFGLLECCEIPEVIEIIKDIKMRKFKMYNFNFPNIVHYGMKELNPMHYVKFYSKDNTGLRVDIIEEDILDTFCPKKFSYIV